MDLKNVSNIYVSLQPLDESQFRQQQSIRRGNISRIAVSHCMFQSVSHVGRIGQMCDVATVVKAQILAVLNNERSKLSSDNRNRSPGSILVGYKCYVLCFSLIDMEGSSWQTKKQKSRKASWCCVNIGVSQ